MRLPDRRLPAALVLLALLLLPAPIGAAPALAAPPAASPTADAPSAADAAAGRWDWPLRPRPEVTRLFDLAHPYAAGHRGVDLAAPPGAEVLAPDDGVVHFAGWVVDRPVLSIAHAGGLLSSFEPVETSLRAGDAVARGEAIGTIAAEPVHAPAGGLHLGARLDGAYLDPLALLGAVPKAVLLPLG
ncbi:MAG: M23 family metallopeptidase [Microbacteriaceae bacterium]|nr:M23 family metallopeptidase [Microbacteriaceae bacterium]